MSKAVTTQLLMHYHELISTHSLRIPFQPLDFQGMATAQTNDPELKEYLVSTSSSLDLKPVPLPFSDSTIICDVSNGTPHPFVLTTFRRKVFDVLRGLSHPGIRASHKLIAG